MRAVHLVAVSIAVALAPTAAAIPPCLDAGPTFVVESETLGVHESVQDPNCYVHGIPWYTLYDHGVPSRYVVTLP